LNPALKRRAIVVASRCDGQMSIAPLVHPKLLLAGSPAKSRTTRYGHELIILMPALNLSINAVLRQRV
jgi:hypothetical protein